MKYKIFHKKTGVQSLDVFSEFQHSEDIRDMCFTDNSNLFFIDSHYLYHLNMNSGIIIELNNPMSICYSSGKLYVSHNDGIIVLDINNDYYPSNLLSPQDNKKIFQKMSKMGVYGVRIDSNGYYVGICVEPLNKCYKVEGKEVILEIGSGEGNYSIAHNIEKSSLRHPQGIIVYDNKSVIITDTGNKCIRYFGKEHRIIFGSPLSGDLSPTKMVLDRKKDLLYFLSKNYLRSINVASGRESMVYNGDRMVSVAINLDGKVFILEKHE